MEIEEELKYRHICIEVSESLHVTNSSFLCFGTNNKKNSIRTTKYTWYNWLPKSVLQQFRRVANAYFLGISILMILGSYATYLFVSPLDPFSTIATLTVILLITSCKEGYEDLLRRKSDEFENNREVTVITFETDSTIKETIKKSKYLKPGDIVLLKGHTSAPADLLLILTSMYKDGNKCYVETANIDGETNLKLREAPSFLLNELGHVIENGKAVPELFNGVVHIEEPNANIHKIVGTLKLDICNDAMPIEAQNILLKSALFSNTDWAYGIVVYAGQETKIQMNSLNAPSKMSKLEHNLNTAIIIIFSAQITLVTISVICVYLLGYNKESDLPYIYPPGEDGSGSILPLWLELWFVFFLLYNNFIPLSLYVTIEIVNLGQAYLIASDNQIYHPELDVPCTVRASNLVQELGEVSNVFTDKTGTLTRNEMKLVKFVINGIIYDMKDPETDANSASSTPTPTTSNTLPGSNHLESHRSFRQPKTVENIISDSEGSDNELDTSLSELKVRTAMKQSTVSSVETSNTKNETINSDDLFKFLRCLMTCHTVVRESNGTYRAESPDELALVEGSSKSYQSQLFERGSREMRVSIQGKHYTYIIHAVNAFNADRKRMSVLLSDKESGKFFVVCKGADNIMLPLCNSTEKEHTKNHAALLQLSNLGLRTLCVAQRELSDNEAVDWITNNRNALLATSNRDNLLAKVAADLEKNMTIVGLTAIEDRLQDEVPEVISDLAKAGIIVWMLTGDKLETAVNIGYSCNLLIPNMNIIMLSGIENSENFTNVLCREHTNLMKELQNESFQQRLTALVLDGPSFAYFDGSIPEQKQQLLEIGRNCRSVIACRLTPLQKRDLVSLVKTDKSLKPQATTLSIGDGANDVSMILEANVGVGIFGKEGRQAANSADFAIGEFKFLRRLLLVHGRWNYIRQSKVFLYSMHKNMVITMTLFWFSFFTAVSGCSPYESWVYSGFNFILGLPIIFFGILDQDLSADFVCRNPQVYSTGRTNTLLNVKSIFEWILNAILYAIVICLIYYYCVYVTFYNLGLYVTGTIIMVGLIMALQFKVMFFHHSWAKPHIYAMLFSIIGMFLYYLLISIAVNDYIGEAVQTYSLGIFWLVSLLLVPVAAIHIDWISYFLSFFFYPTNEMLYRELEKKENYDRWNTLTCCSKTIENDTNSNNELNSCNDSSQRDSDTSSTVSMSAPILKPNPLFAGKIKPNPMEIQ